MTNTTPRIVIVGAGFSALWAALSAARKLHLAGQPDGAVEIVLIAPEPILHMRPRLYESDLSEASVAIIPLLDTVGVGYVQGTVQHVDVEKNRLEYHSEAGETLFLNFDRLVLASGSKLSRPQSVAGLQEHGWDVDQMDSALKLGVHLQSLATLPDSPARNTVVVCGGGFTGVEVAAEMPSRLRNILGDSADIKVIVLERAETVCPEMPPPPRPVIAEALIDLGVEVLLGETVISLDPEGVTTASGTRIASKTVIWSAGMRASDLTAHIPAHRDAIGRLHVSQDLNISAPGLRHIYATGDTAHIAVDDAGHLALQSCQHAIYMGKAAGNNVMADVLGLPLAPYRQPRYTMGIALGAWGGVFAVGWDQRVESVKEEAQKVKTYVNTEVIYPPPPDRDLLFAAADPNVQSPVC
ncbi:FAD-dependent pyridine nucleotide-disulfide oxidoreductase [Mycena olivaceomarginata]|nr:FAD-dependent pyridine nucleotide-disulfide oxidoreductase [Mycena olivaceomarginata]